MARTMKEIFGMNLRQAMKTRGVTQSQLAALMHTSQANISRIINGDEDVTMTRAKKFADALECSLAELVEEKELEKV